MKKRRSFLFAIFLLFLFPISYFTLNEYINFDTLSAIIFLVVVGFLIIKYRKSLDFQVMLKLFMIPLIYAVLSRTKFGLKFMDKAASKYRELVKFLGYCFIGVGFIGMVYISIQILVLLSSLFLTPREASQAVSPVLPLTNIPGLGYLSFWHFLISIFIAVLIHEFAHGIVARAHNIPVKSSGLGIFSVVVPLFPLAFVEPDEKRLNKEQDVVQYSIFSAGPVINIIFAILVYVILAFAIVPIENNITQPIGFSFNGMLENYSAEQAGMKSGMIINSVNGVEVLDFQSFTEKTGPLNPDQELTIGVDNGSAFRIVTKPSPDDPEKGYIGILTIQNERMIMEKYSSFNKPFFWLKNLLRWVAILNLIIGLMNLLPIIITDGGRMLKILLGKLFRDGKKADKVWLFIGILFIFPIALALLLRLSFWVLSLFGVA